MLFFFSVLQVCTKFVDDPDVPAFQTETDLTGITAYVKILEPAYDLSLQMQNDTSPTLSSLPQWIVNLKATWAPTENDSKSADRFRAELLKGLVSRFDFLFADVNLALLAAAMDPR